MFGLIADSVLYLKIDQETEDEFTAKGLEPFTYSKKGKEFKMSYYQAPDGVVAMQRVQELSQPVPILSDP
jgi:DNA transformation protein